MLVLALLLLLVGTFFALEAVVAPARERRVLLRRAAAYGSLSRSRAQAAEPLRGRMLELVAQALARTVLKLNPKTSLELVRVRLRDAGLARRMSPLGYLALRGATALGGLVVGVAFGAASGSALGAIVLVAACGALGFFLPEFALSSLARARKERISTMLPDALDLLAVSVEAGLGFDASLVKLIEHMHGPLIDEFALTVNEIRMGESRHTALRHLAERVGTTEMASFVRAVLHADHMGISLGRILRLQAQEARLRRQTVAEEKAMKVPVKMLFPTVLFIFPAVFLIVLGPAFLNFGEFF